MRRIHPLQMELFPGPRPLPPPCAKRRQSGDYLRNPQLVRQWRVLQLLEDRGFTLPELAERLTVAARTVRRDVNALEASGFPVIVDDDGRWRIVTERRSA